MEKSTFISHYCQNYRILEDRVIESGDYVSIDPTNNHTFSPNFILLFINICSEIDSLAGEYCKSISPDKDNSHCNIVDKINCITEKHSNLRNNKVATRFPFIKQHLVPFKKIDRNTLSWWTDYNRVKHNRTEKDENDRFYYQRANLKNTLSSLAALYVLIRFVGEQPEFNIDFSFSSRLFEDKIE